VGKPILRLVPASRYPWGDRRERGRDPDPIGGLAAVTGPCASRSFGAVLDPHPHHVEKIKDGE